MMRRVAVIALLVLALAAPVWAAGARALVEQGNEAYAEGNYEQALTAYQEAARLKPESAEIQINLGNAYVQQGDVQKALQAYGRALATQDEELRARALYNQGTARLSMQDYDGAIDALRQSLRLTPTDEDARYNLAYALKMKQEQQEQEQEQQEQDQEQDQQDQEEQEQDQQEQEEQQEQDQEQQEQDQEQQDQEQQEQDQQEQEQQQPEQQESEQQQAEQQQAEETTPPPDEQIDPAMAAQLLDQLLEEEQEELKLRMQRGTSDEDVDQDW